MECSLIAETSAVRIFSNMAPAPRAFKLKANGFQFQKAKNFISPKVKHKKIFHECATSVYCWNSVINLFLNRKILSRIAFQCGAEKNDHLTNSIKCSQSMPVKGNVVTRPKFPPFSHKDVISCWNKFVCPEKHGAAEEKDDNLLPGRKRKLLEEGMHRLIGLLVRVKIWDDQIRQYSSLWAKSNSANASASEKNNWGSPEAERAVVQFNLNFPDTMKTYDSLLVFYHTNWCAVCKKMKPLYGAAALKMKQENIPGTLGALDLTNNMELADMFNVIAVPVMRYYRNGILMKTYDGKREANEIIKFMKNPPLKPVKAKVIDI